jgi:vacuolar-type H+-ATPase subunit E/Vma4
VATDALRASIESEGRARVIAILRDAEEEAARLRDEALSLASQRHGKELRNQEVELRRAANVRIAAARAGTRTRVLEARADLLDRVFAMAEQALSAELEADSARDELVARAERALGFMPPNSPVVLICSSSVAPVLETELGKRDGVRVECDPELPAGFRAVGADGAIVVDATLAKLLELDRAALAIEILRRVESDRDGGA